MLELRNVTKTFDHSKKAPVVALKEVSFTVNRGDFVSIVGPSGSGKSTLLFIIGALMSPTSGDVFLLDENMYDTSSAYRSELRLRKIGFVFQTFNLIPYLGALENVALPAMLDGEPRRSALERASSLLERFGLGARLDHKFAELSVGERQRVAICRSVINDPEIILADEPTGNLDRDMTHEVMGLLAELNDGGHTIAVVTHEAEVASYGKRIMYLKEGSISDGVPQ